MSPRQRALSPCIMLDTLLMNNDNINHKTYVQYDKVCYDIIRYDLILYDKIYLWNFVLDLNAVYINVFKAAKHTKRIYVFFLVWNSSKMTDNIAVNLMWGDELFNSCLHSLNFFLKWVFLLFGLRSQIAPPVQSILQEQLKCNPSISTTECYLLFYTILNNCLPLHLILIYYNS